MYGIIGSAIVTGMISVLVIKRFQLKTVSGDVIVIPKKEFHWGKCLRRVGFLVGVGGVGRLARAPRRGWVWPSLFLPGIKMTRNTGDHQHRPGSHLPYIY